MINTHSHNFIEMVNILELVKGQLGSAAIGKVAEMLGEGSDKTSSALDAAIPSILGGIIGKGSSKEGASGIMDFLTEKKIDGGMFDNVMGLLGDGGKTKTLMNLGSMALPFILGGKKAGFMNLISKVTGFGSGASGSLMSLVAPMVLGMIGKQVKKGGLNAGGLMDLLSGQKDHVAKAMPAGMGDLLGFANSNSGSTRAKATSTARQTVETAPQGSGGGGMLKWLLPLALVAAAAWYFTKDGCASSTANNAAATTNEVTTGVQDAATKTMDKVGTVANKTGSGTTELAAEAKDMASTTTSTTMDKAGEVAGTVGSTVNNAADAAGEVMYKLDDNGNMIDASGKIVYNKSDFKIENGYYVDANGKRIGKAWQKIKDAVNNAGEKTAAFFSKTFGDMFAKKEGAKTEYTLSQMKFDAKSQRITYYSIEELKGLAEALKAKTDTKINVAVHTADGKNKAESKRLSSLRAQQIMDMLKTLGVKASQLSSDGKGNGNEAKAAANAIEIKVK